MKLALCPEVGSEFAVIQAGALEQVIAELELLNRNTEQDFLRLGGKLGEFIGAVSVISAALTALANLISGTDGLNTARSLEAAFACFTEMKAQYKDRKNGLAFMRHEAARLRHNLAGFEEIVSNLNAIGLLTRIEIARLGSSGADFGTLASDMRALTGDVEIKVGHALATGDLLISPIESAMENIAALDEKQVADLSLAFGNLSAFRNIQNTAREASARLGARYDAISAGFRKLIVSIQFHDVTRQLVEHVIDVLRRLRAESEAENGSAAGRVGAVLALQSSHLAEAAGKFAASVASVAQNLDEIASHIAEMADETRTLSAGADNPGEPYFFQMERGCTAILANLKVLAEADSASRLIRDGIEEKITRMRTSNREIQRLEVQMANMAMNATIAATHIGVLGDAINVLALSVGAQARESGTRSASLGQVLDSLDDAANRVFGQQGTDATARQISQDESLEGMLIAVAEMHTSGERSVPRIAAIVDSSIRLRDDLSAAGRDFSVGALFAQTIARACMMLDEIGAGDGALPLDGSLDDFALHYTMQSERDVHNSVTGATGQPEEADEPGGNVEFF